MKLRAQSIIFDLCQENNGWLIALEIMPDHIHLFLESDPSYSPSTIIKIIKGRLSHHLRKEFSELLILPTLSTS
jgi:putative transposase